jgi:hypothetical protein
MNKSSRVKKERDQDKIDIEKRRDTVIKRMLNTPPKEHPKPEPGRKPGRPVKDSSSS